MGDSDSNINAGQNTFSYADKRLYRSFLKLFCNHLHEHSDGSIGFNLKLEHFGAYDVNREAIRNTLNDTVRAFGSSVYFLDIGEEKQWTKVMKLSI